MDKQDTRQNTELKQSVVQSVLLCLSCPFMYILTSEFIKKKKKKKKKRIKSLNFAESNAHRKTNAHGSFETYNLFFLALLDENDIKLTNKILTLFNSIYT